jgi:ligand-binding SRPBCC domain-containing protein
MPTVQFETAIAAPLLKVWEFHQDPRTSLANITPSDQQAVIEHVDEPMIEGSRVIINTRGPLGRIRWVAKIVEIVPPHAVVFGEEARFVDEQESGPFKYWRHAHEFERIDENTTRIVDTITYRLPLGPLGWLADRLYVAPKLRRMFAYRHEATRRTLESPG